MRALVCLAAALIATPAWAGAGPLPLTAAVSLDASTSEPTAEGSYPAWNVADAAPQTAWVANGKRLVLGFPAAKIVAIELIPGYAKSAALWSANRRVLAVRFRFYPQSGLPTAWRTAPVAAPERFTTVADAIVTLDAVTDSSMVALELEVTEATPKTKSDDIVVSMVRVQASGAPPCPKGERWRYLEAIAGTPWELGDRLAADFDRYDLDACTAQHEGTGGGTKTFAGRCKKVKDGVRFDGATSTLDGVANDAPTPYRKTIAVRRFGCGIAVIDGRVYTR